MSQFKMLPSFSLLLRPDSKSAIALLALSLLLASCAKEGQLQAPQPAATTDSVQVALAEPEFNLSEGQPEETAQEALSSAAGSQPSRLAAALKSALKSGKKSQIGQTEIDGALLRKLYSPRSYEPFFVDNSGHKPMVDDFKVAMANVAAKNGLRGQDYWNADLDSRFNSQQSQAVPPDLKPSLELELLLAQQTLTLASDLSTGRLNPKITVQDIPDLELGKRSFEAFSELAAMLQQPAQIEDQLGSFAPHHAMYATLQTQLAILLGVQSNGGWPKLGSVKKLKPGQKNPVVPMIRQRLVDLGTMTDASQRENRSTVYDSALIAAVRSFQDGAKLQADGVIGQTTMAALQIPLETRIDQLRANLEKWRLLPVDLGGRYIFVSLGAQQFELFDGENEAAASSPKLAFRTVVGQESRETPSFIDELDAVIINPYWTSPPDIIVKDVLPKAVGHPEYWAKLHMRVFDHDKEVDPSTVDWSQYTLTNLPPYDFREDSGPANSLGLIKFNLSKNSHSIYMHDTNARELFNQPRREFSSGCIRLQKPFDLATYLLSPQGIDQAEITRMTSDRSINAKEIQVKTPIKVYIVDTTIMVDRTTNGLAFGPDVYELDTRIVDALNGTPSTKPPSTVNNGQP